MNKLLVSFGVLCIVGLTGCAQLNERVYGSWLDRVGQTPAGLRAITPEQATAMQAEAVQLRAEAETIRTRLGVERDRVRRFAYLRELEAVGDKLRPLEKALRYGGVEAPPAPV